MIAAIGEGRRIYANVRASLRYALADGVAEVLVGAAATYRPPTVDVPG